MSRRRWFQMRLVVRIGRRRVLLAFPPKRIRWWYFIGAFCLLAGYVLGAVPTIMLLDQCGLGKTCRPLIEIVYFPLILLSDYSPWFGSLFEAEHTFLNWLTGK